MSTIRPPTRQALAGQTSVKPETGSTYLETLQVAASKPFGSAPEVLGCPAVVRLRAVRTTSPSTRHSYVTKPRSRKDPVAGGRIVK